MPSIGIVTLSAISIHALREEGDPLVPNFDVCTNRFQSTPSARRATHNIYSVRDNSAISIHALREEGDRQNRQNRPRPKHFNPRPPRGGRPTPVIAMISSSPFQSTPSARRATKHQLSESSRRYISIHALREEGDAAACSPWLQRQDFNPRPPRGGRPLCPAPDYRAAQISIHALREEGDTIWMRPMSR